jgi:hypothetical protein
MRRSLHRLRDERGEGLISGLILIAGILIPLMFIVPLFGRIETARLAVEQAARDAVRAATLSATPQQASSAAQAAIETTGQESGTTIRGALSGQFARGSVLTVEAHTSIRLVGLPGLVSFGTVTISGQASAPIDQYRSLLPTSQ